MRTVHGSVEILKNWKLSGRSWLALAHLRPGNERRSEEEAERDDEKSARKPYVKLERASEQAYQQTR
jgi:hypothetical protein